VISSARLAPLRGRASGWAVLVPVVALLAGLLFATSGRTAQGTDLRAGEVTELSQLIDQRNADITRQEQQLADLQAQVERLTEQAASRNGAVAAAQRRGDAGALSVGLVALQGAGVVITLDDAPQRADGTLPLNARPDAWSSTSPMSRRSSTRCGPPAPTGWPSWTSG
jgi:uncharacterized protein YlxW (UPF0749 family)